MKKKKLWRCVLTREVVQQATIEVRALGHEDAADIAMGRMMQDTDSIEWPLLNYQITSHRVISTEELTDAPNR